MNVIDQFLNNNCDAKSTRDNYRSGLNHFFKTLKIDESNNYFKSNRNYNEDIMTFWKELQNFAPMTRSARISVVRNFFEEFDIELDKKIKKRLKQKMKHTRAVTLDVIPTNKQLRQILNHGETKARALGLLASSSGMRINEILGLTEKDIDFEQQPIKIFVRSEIAKFGLARICFCSSEAGESIKEWLKEREQYLYSACARTSSFTGKNPDDDTIFCFNQVTATKIWNRLLRDSGFDERDNSTKSRYHRMHFHTLRKFFKTRLLNAGVQEAIINKLIGHTGYLDSSYVRLTDKELADGYNKGVKDLLIFETTPDLTDVHKELVEKDKQIKDLNEMMDEMKAQILELRLEKLEKANGIKKV